MRVSPCVSRLQQEKLAVLIRECGASGNPAEGRALHARVLASQHCGNRFLTNLLIQMYGSLGHAGSARSLFDNMEEPNAFSWKMMIQAYVRNGQLSEATYLFQRMPHKDAIAWNAMLAGYTQVGYADLGREVFEAMPERTVVSWNTMLAAYAQAGHQEGAVSCFVRMPETNTVSWNTTMQVLAQDGHHSEAKSMFDAMHDRTLVSWNVLLLQACSRDIVEAEDLFRKMPSRSVASWSPMIVAYGEWGDAGAAKNAFEDMPERNVVSWTALFQALAHNGYLEAAHQVFSRMPQWSLVSWNARLQAASSLNDAVDIFHTMPCRNVVSWTTMLQAYGRSGQLVGAKESFDIMPGRTIVTWNAMLQASTMASDDDAVPSVLRAMPQWDAVSWATLISGYADKGQTTKAWETFITQVPGRSLGTWLAMFRACRPLEVVNLYERMPVHCLSAANTTILNQPNLDETEAMFNASMPFRDVVSWTSLLAAYGQRACSARAEAAFWKMPAHDVVAGNAMLQAYVQDKRPVDAAALLFSGGISRNVVSWNTVGHGWALVGQADEAKRLLGKMPQHNAVSLTALLVTGDVEVFADEHLDAVGWNALLQASQQDVETSKQLFDCMPRRTSVSWNEMICVYGRSGHLGKAEAVFGCMPCWDVVSWNTLVSGHSQQARLPQAKLLVQQMPESNVVSWNTLLEAYAVDGQTRQVLDLHAAMSLEGVLANEVSFVSILAACSHLGDLNLVSSCFHSMALDVDVSARREHYVCLVDALGRAGRLADAEKLIWSMPFTPDVVAWASLLTAARDNLDACRAARAASQILQLEQEAGDSWPYILLANTYSDLGGGMTNIDDR